MDSMLKFFSSSDSNPKSSKELIRHSNGDSVVFVEDHFCVLDSEKKLVTWCGLTDVIKDIFFRDYSTPNNQWKRKRFVRSGKEIGTRVHRQIHHMHTCIPKENCNCITKTSPKRLNSKTRMAMKFLKDYEITCDATEFSIISRASKCCTNVDMIGRRWVGTPQEKSVLISWKTGYQMDYDKNKKGQMLSEPLENYSSSPKHHNQLQAILEYEIISREYELNFDDYFVVYLEHKSKDTYEVEHLRAQELYSREKDSIYTHFCSIRNSKK